MAQVFPLDFRFHGSTHPAIVSVRTVAGDRRVHVQLTGNGLEHIVPEGELSFTISNATRQPAVAPRPGFNELQQAIRIAVLQQLRNS